MTVDGHPPHTNQSLHHHLRHPGRLGKIIFGDQEIENEELRMEDYRQFGQDRGTLPSGRRSSLIGPKIGVCPEPIGRAIV